MASIKFWFLDVGHGDSSYIELSNGARIMIDCGCGADHWPSKLLKHFSVTAKDKPVSILNESRKFGLDKLIISHPHGDHIADIEAIHDEIKFCWLRGGYAAFIDEITQSIDYRKRNEEAVKKFVDVVKHYTGEYDSSRDRTVQACPPCAVEHKRFLVYAKGMDLNELSWFSSFAIGSHKVLYAGDMTSAGIRKILDSNRAEEFKEFVKGTTIFKTTHHGRENGCSEELFKAFGNKPLLCIISDEVLNERNEGTASTQWYHDRTSEDKVLVDGIMQNRRVLTTRKDKDIYIEIDDSGTLSVTTNCFADIRPKILEQEAVYG